MQTQQTITLFGTVSNSATSRISKNGRKYTAFGVAIISDRNLQAFHYNVVAFGKQGHFAKPLQTGTRIKLVVQAQSQPDNIATLPLLTATFVRPVRPVARGGNACPGRWLKQKHRNRRRYGSCCYLGGADCWPTFSFGVD
jgi:hypothetical protein